ncbi:energy-coupling factor transporter transmembrane component T family protein [Alkalicoccobacillus porphyridii]|uniref:energy-coupling factor transporter transmembrane component T family protein n=1 Tax=Alkalicoccobacillus porphyridii TaxID=2597270 RepID=UPI0021B0F212|nr:energy-coupling factor transporter transmembrane component T [Alkalicoccobacillus porphyridii]
MAYSIIGQYVPTNSIIHRLDPRSKTIAVFVLAIVVFMAGNFPALLAMLGGAFVLAAITRIPARFFVRSLKPVLILVGFFFIFHLFFTQEGTELVSLGALTLYSGGVTKGLFVSLRILTLVLFASFLTLTTRTVDLTNGLEKLLSPLKRIKIPTSEFVLMMMIAMRYIPILMEETKRLSMAQAARGADITSGTILSRMKALNPLLLPLIVQSFKQAETMAQAMEARGYRMGAERTQIRLLTWKKADTWTLVFTGMIAAIILITRS